MSYQANSCPRNIHVSKDIDSLLTNFITKLPDCFEHTGHTIHQARNEIKVYQCDKEKINVKKYCIPLLIWNRVFYSLGIRIPKAKRAYINALKILERGFDTPKPFGYIIERGAWLINHSYFISQQIDDMAPIGHNCKDKRMAKALAGYTAQLHSKGLLHMDFTPNNILYSNIQGTYNFMLVDINRFICKNGPINILHATRSLIKPFANLTILKIYISTYAKYRGCNKLILIRIVLLLMYIRKQYDALKDVLKKIPGAHYISGKRI